MNFYFLLIAISHLISYETWFTYWLCLFTDLSIVFHYSKQMYAVHDGGLVEFSRHSEVLLQLFLADGIQHTSIHQVRQERLGVLLDKINMNSIFMQLFRNIWDKFQDTSSFVRFSYHTCDSPKSGSHSAATQACVNCPILGFLTRSGRLRSSMASRSFLRCIGCEMPSPTSRSASDSSSRTCPFKARI